jgi:HAD superfamily phosphoserine phosphatase-like hydrolase
MNDIKLLAFDVDGTLTEGFSWERFHKIAGITPEEDRRWQDDYYIRQKITFAEWMKLLEDRYVESRKTEADFMEVADKIVFKPHAEQVIRQLQKMYEVCLVSSGLNIFVSAVAKRLSIKNYNANFSFECHPDGTIRRLAYKTTERLAKVNFLKNICIQRSLQPEQIVFVGDSYNDLDAFNFTHRGILMGDGYKELVEASWKKVTSLAEIPALLA